MVTLDHAWQEFMDAMLGGQYFEAHEILEIPWRKTHEHRLQVAIWVAAAYVHAGRRHPTGARRIFSRILDDAEMNDPVIRTFIEARLLELDRGLDPEAPIRTLLDQLRRWAEHQPPVAGC